MAAYTDTFENKLVDFLFRAQALGLATSTAAAGTGPANWYVGLLTAVPTDSTAGTEVPSTNAYARVAIVSSLANWAGTQGAGTTVVSSGSSGTTSNNNVIQFPTPTGAGWGTVTSLGLYDAATGGALHAFSLLGSNQTINVGNNVNFPAASLTVQVDN